MRHLLLKPHETISIMVNTTWAQLFKRQVKLTPG